MNTFRKTLCFALMCTVLWVAPASAQYKDPDPATDPPAGAPEEPQALSWDPVLYTNENGDFQILFPGGCGKLVTRANEPDLFGGEDWSDIIQVTLTYCDRFQNKGEGCSVNATYNMPGDDGTIAGPNQVIELVEKSLAGFGAEVVEQHPIKKDFGDEVIVEGVEVRAQAEEGPGQVWIRGLLVDGDIYILAAWNDKGGLWRDSDYIAFFNSFQPWVD